MCINKFEHGFSYCLRRRQSFEHIFCSSCSHSVILAGQSLARGPSGWCVDHCIVTGVRRAVPIVPSHTLMSQNLVFLPHFLCLYF
jgi:hypothetical protein